MKPDTDGLYLQPCVITAGEFAGRRGVVECLYTGTAIVAQEWIRAPGCWRVRLEECEAGEAGRVYAVPREAVRVLQEEWREANGMNALPTQAAPAPAVSSATAVRAW